MIQGFIFSPLADAKTPSILIEIEKHYSIKKTLQAEFTQVNHKVMLGRDETSTGILMVNRPGKMRWETLRPEKNLLVSDGKTFWFFTPGMDETEEGQVIVRKSSEVQSKVMNALLSGELSVFKSVIELKPGKSSTATDSHKNEKVFVLTPKPGTAGTVLKAEVTVDAEKKLIVRVRLTNKGGNTSEISLSKIELGKDLDARFFKFDIPPGVDVVKE